MWEWKKSVENCFFTDHLDECLKEFLDSQKVFSNDGERWEFLFKNAYAWKRNCSVDFDCMMMPSFFRQWNIYAFWGEFSFPDHNLYTLEETLYWIFLTGWVLIDEYGRGERISDFPNEDLDWRLQEQFCYSKETCSWLDKRQFLKEIRGIYSRSQEVFHYYQEHPENNNSPWVCSMEPDCSRFLDYYAFCKRHLKNPEIVRLNEFEPDEYVRYLIREGDTLYFLQLFDMG